MRPTATLLLVLAALFSRPARAQEVARTIEFIENRGQWDAHARYAAQVAPGARLFVEKTGLTYALTAGLPGHGSQPAGPTQSGRASGSLPTHGLRLEFVQPSPTATLGPESETEAPGRRHYLRGTAAHWATDVRAWRQLRYRQLWSGIDLLLKESPQQQFEYDLLLSPGADPARAQWRYRGAESLRLDPATGQLRVQTSAGTLTDFRPEAWQTNPATGARQPVACAFVLRGEVVGFKLGKYDAGRPLVIDPAVQFASYTGSPVENWGFAATHDAAGNLYTAGVVFEPGYPVTTGAYQTAFAGSTDIAIMKFTTSATGPGARAWATYLGGNNLEFPHSLLVNDRNELLLLGTTASTDFPTTTTALSRTLLGGPVIAPFGSNSPFVLSGGADLVLTRLSANGGRLRASTYLGGTGTDGLLDPSAAAPRLRHNYGDAFRGDLALDPQGNVYVASVTSSADFPGLVPGNYRGGTSDGLVTSLDSGLTRVRWTTLLGGPGADAAYSLQREEAGGGLLVAGGTTSTSMAGAIGGYQAAPGGGVDGFVARLLPGGALLQSTYLGTSAYDQAFFVRQGPGGQVYVLGQTLAPAWPGLDATRYHTAQGQQFIQQLASDLKSAVFATVFGSGRTTTDISPTAFGVDCYGRILLAGWGGGLDPNNGSTTGLPVTANALQNNTDSQDFYLMQLSDGARVLDYATFFGTSADDHVDGGTSRFDSQGILYQAVCACDQGGVGTGSLPIPPGAFTYAAGNGAPRCNNAAFKFAFLAAASPAGTDTLSVCAQAGAVALGGSPAGGTWTGPGVRGSVASGFTFQPDSSRVGLNVLTYTSPGAANGCTGTSTRRITVLPQGRATASTPRNTFCLQPGTVPVALVGRPAGGTWHGKGIVPGTSRFDPWLAGPGTHALTYEVSAGRCPVVANLQMRVKTVPPPTPLPPRKVCLNDPPTSLGGSPEGGIWTGPGVSGSIGSFVFTPSPALLGGPHILLYTFQGDTDCDAVTDTLRMTVLPPGPTGAAPPDTAFCLSSRPFRLRGGLPLGGEWSGPGVSGSVATGFFFTPSPLVTGAQTLLYTGPLANSPACPGRANRVVTVNTSGVATVSIPDTLMCAVAGPQRLTAVPDGGIWTGPGVSGSVTSGFFFTPMAALAGVQTLAYAGPTPANATDCPMAATLRLRVLALPPLFFAPVGNVSFCLTAPPHGIVLSATPAGGTFSGPGVVGNRFNPSDAGPGRHTLTYTWDFPEIRCPITISQTVPVSLVPAVHLPADTVLCTGLAPLALRASPAGGTWTGPGVTPAGLFTPPAVPGTTTLYYELPGSCDPAPYRVTVPAQLSAQAHWMVPACSDNARAPRLLRFEATGPAAGQVQWDFGDGTAPATGAAVEHRYATAGRFQPLATLPAAPAGACPNELTLPPVDVQAARVPNIITPNADGLNDTFAPEIGGCPGHLQVFSRWGQQVFDTPTYQNDWGGAGLPSGLYYYLLHDADGATLGKGWVEIVR